MTAPQFFAAKLEGALAAIRFLRPGEERMATVMKLAPTAQPEPGTVHWLNTSIDRGKSEVFSEVASVSPGLAAVILNSRNADNRPVKRKVDIYASDMRNGLWQFNGEPLIFASDGLLNDGQHRLQAVIDANISQQFICIFGVTRASRMTVDQGAARCAGDYLGMGGTKNAHTLAAVAKGVLSFERGNGIRIAPKEISNSEVVSRAKTDSGIADACDYAVEAYRSTRSFAAPKVIGTAFYLLADVHPGDAKEYMDAVCYGEGLKRKDPAYAAREALINLGQATLQAKLEVIFRGWVAFRQNRTLQMAKVLGSFPALI